ncbi:hypothetical protein ACR3H8_20715 [Pseudomonas aeruginosa]|uniref:hypothetical protein n=1 Tax=Pseudomonas aeruginosa TaxID=287 RepID=UPI0021B01EDA|nr:hypothetical protein [Pseudomonas aeruginosa]
MWIITHDKQHVRELSVAERSLVVRHTEGSLTRTEQADAASLLREIRKKSYWLGCDCVSKSMPIMNIALRDTGTLVVRNNASGPAHDPACPLLKQETDKSSGAARTEYVARVQPEGVLSLHKDFPSDSTSPGKTPTGTGSVSTGKRKKLLSLLLTVMESAGLHEFDPGNEKDLSAQFQRFREALWRFSLAPRVPVQSYSDTRIDRRRVVSLSMNLKESSSFGHHRKYGLMADVVSGTASRKISLLDGSELDFFGHIERWTDAPGPLMALATLTTQSARPNFFELGHVATIPVLSNKTLLPVSDGAERAHVESLLDLLRWLYGKKVRVILRRPLFADSHFIDLQGRGRQLSVDLSSGLVPGAPPSPSFLSLDEFEGDMDLLKRKVSGFFRKDT